MAGQIWLSGCSLLTLVLMSWRISLICCLLFRIDFLYCPLCFYCFGCEFQTSIYCCKIIAIFLYNPTCWLCKSYSSLAFVLFGAMFFYISLRMQSGNLLDVVTGNDNSQSLSDDTLSACRTCLMVFIGYALLSLFHLSIKKDLSSCSEFKQTDMGLPFRLHTVRPSFPC